MSTPKALLKKEVRRGLRGGGLSRKEYILSSKAESEDSFSLIWGRQIKDIEEIVSLKLPVVHRRL